MKSTRKNLVNLIAAAGLVAATGLVYGQAAITPFSPDEVSGSISPQEDAVQQNGAVEDSAQSAPAAEPGVGGTIAPVMGGAVTGGSADESSAFPSEQPDTNTIDD